MNHALPKFATAEESLRTFYESREYRLVSQGISDQHSMTPDYIVDDILAEKSHAPAQHLR